MTEIVTSHARYLPQPCAKCGREMTDTVTGIAAIGLDLNATVFSRLVFARIYPGEPPAENWSICFTCARRVFGLTDG